MRGMVSVTVGGRRARVRGGVGAWGAWVLEFEKARWGTRRAKPQEGEGFSPFSFSLTNAP
jgi:hypothetical protein